MNAYWFLRRTTQSFSRSRSISANLFTLYDLKLLYLPSPKKKHLDDDDVPETYRRPLPFPVYSVDGRGRETLWGRSVTREESRDGRDG